MKTKGLVPLTQRQISMIVGNIRKVITTNDINLLSKQAYNFLYLASGFIAHYNLYGFRDAYGTGRALARDILRNKGINQWDNFRPGERDYEYMMGKKACYNQICDMLNESGIVFL